jgi:hypothetical protein
MIDRLMSMAVGKISRCINLDCLNIFLMSTNENESYREFCPVCQMEMFETIFGRADDEDHESDA